VANVAKVCCIVQHMPLLQERCKRYMLTHYRDVANSPDFEVLPRNLLIGLIRDYLK